MRMTLLVRRIYAMRTCKPKTLLRQHISNIEHLYENNIVRQYCNDIETILLGNLQRSSMSMFWQYSMLCGIISFLRLLFFFFCNLLWIRRAQTDKRIETLMC